MSGRALPVAGTADFPALEGLWWLDGDLLDQSANNYDLTMAVGAALYASVGTLPRNATDGYGGLSLYATDQLTGIWASRVNADTAPLEGDANGNVTTCCLVRTEEALDTNQVAAASWSGAGDVPWILYPWGVTNDLPSFSYTDTGGALQNIHAPVRLINYQWNFYMVRRTVDPGVDCDIDFFINGEKYSSPGENEPSTTYAGTPTFNVARTATASHDLRGAVTQVGVWPSALTDAQCLSIAQYVVPNMCRAA
jgi:hypothetical protein